ncbi:MAG: ArnT family glycosyltransferase [Anaerolineae bacterium]
MNILEDRGYNDTDGKPTIWREPFYPYFMASVWALGGQSEEIIQVANSALGGLAATLTYLLAYYSFGRGVGLGAALLYSCFPLNIWYVPLYRYEALFTPLVTLCGIFYIRLREHLRWRDAILMGVALGLATLNSQVVLLMPSVSIVASLGSPRWKRLLLRVAVAMLVMGGVIFPWTLRNYIVTGGEFIIVRQGGPANFLLGNYAVAHYDETPMQLSSLRRLAKDNYVATILETTGATSINEVDPIEREKILGQEVTNFLKTQPEQFVRKVIIQSIRFWYLGDTRPKSLFILSTQLPLLVMAVLGVVYAIRQRKPFIFYVLTIFYFNLIYAAIWVEARYSVPVEPYVMALASYGLLSLTPVQRSVESCRLAFQHRGK